MALTKQPFLKHSFVSKIVLPVILMTGVIAYLLYRNYDLEHWQRLPDVSYFWLGVALLVLFIRDFGYMYRIRYITDKMLSWRQSFNVIMLWEFASCALPSVIGGSTVATYFLYKEKIPLGKSLAHVMVTALLDNIYFALAVPLVFILTKGQFLPELVGLSASFRYTLSIAFVISYLLVALYASLLFYALFMNPKGVKRFLLHVAEMKVFRRWDDFLIRHANELLVASKQLHHKSNAYWLRACISTALVWTSRYIIIGCMVAAYTHLSVQDHLHIFSQSLIYKIVLFVSIAPGASGLTEAAFPAFFGAYLGGFATVIVLSYRILTYYLYLIIGALVLPRWLIRTGKHRAARVSVGHVLGRSQSVAM